MKQFYPSQSHEFSKEPSIQLIANSIDSNMSAVAGEQCKFNIKIH